MKKEIIKDEVIDIKNMIYEINGKEVMLDTDLAELYYVETKRINEAVKNNPDKFPSRFSWKISVDETKKISRSKFSTLNTKQGNNIKYGARVFTEQGIYMLATILKSKKATEVSIRIMDTFVKLRQYISFSNNILPYRFLLLEDKVDENTKRIDELFNSFSPKEIIRKSIFFEGEIYDAYTILLDILSTAKNEIIIIDNYINNEVLDLVKDTNKKIIIVSKDFNEQLKNKYVSQYKNVTFIKNNSFHDRFLIIDNKKLYTSGSSFKDIGKKCFVMSELHDKEYIEKIVNIIKNEKGE